MAQNRANKRTKEYNFGFSDIFLKNYIIHGNLFFIREVVLKQRSHHFLANFSAQRSLRHSLFAIADHYDRDKCPHCRTSLRLTNNFRNSKSWRIMERIKAMNWHFTVFTDTNDKSFWIGIAKRRPKNDSFHWESLSLDDRFRTRNSFERIFRLKKL